MEIEWSTKEKNSTQKDSQQIQWKDSTRKNEAACNCMKDEELKMKKGIDTNSIRRCNDNT